MVHGFVVGNLIIFTFHIHEYHHIHTQRSRKLKNSSRSRLPSPLSRLATIAAATHAFPRFEPSSHCTILGEWPIASRAHVRWMRWFCWSCMVAALREVILDMFFSSSPSTCSMAPAAATSAITRYDRGL